MSGAFTPQQEMTRYLVDTTALIDFSKGRDPARTRLLEMIEAGDDLGVSAVNVAEFYTGIPADKRAVWDEFFRSLAYWEITRAAAVHAGLQRYDFLRRGQTLSTTDALVAAVAWEQHATLITNNIKDYPMTDIRLVSLIHEEPGH